MYFDEATRTITFKPTSSGEHIIRLRLEDPELAYRIESLVVHFIYSAEIEKEIKIIKEEIAEENAENGEQ